MSLNLASILFESAKHHKDQVALSCGVTYEGLAGRVACFALFLRGKGVKPGDRVALMSENRPEFTVAYFAILSVGAVVVPVSTLLSYREVAFCLGHAQALAIIFSASVDQVVRESLTDVDHTPLMLSIEPLCEDFKNETCAGVDNPFEPTATEPDDTAVIFYTSGTTGQPKGAEVTHFNLYSNAQWVSERSLSHDSKVGEYWGPGHCTLAALALSHSFGQTCMQNAPLLNGGCISYLSRFDANTLAALLVKEQVTILAAVPRMIKELLELPDFSPESFIHFKYCLVGGAPINQEIVEKFEARFHVSVLEGYGLSETSPVIVFRTPAIPRKEGSVGRAIRGVEVCVVDDDGQRLNAGDVGEIVVRGHAVMKGYYQDESATQESIRDGWLHTGDVGYLDDEGDVFLVDRKKDIIIRNGYNIYPAEVELVLGAFPGVIESAVVGVADVKCGEEVKAFVVGDVDPNALRVFSRSQLAAYKYPRIIEIVTELPKGTKGQVLRRALRVSI